MKLFHALVCACLVSCATIAGPAMAAESARNPLSVHVLNLQDGLPASGVEVRLERLDAGHWVQLGDMRTGSDGRINALYPANQKLQTGTYRVVFESGAWFKAHHAKTFFPEIPVVFEMNASQAHYHVPLLLSPFGYSVYRGS